MNDNFLILKIKTFWLQLRIYIEEKIDCRVYYNLILLEIIYFINFLSQARYIIIKDYREFYIK